MNSNQMTVPNSSAMRTQLRNACENFGVVSSACRAAQIIARHNVGQIANEILALTPIPIPWLADIVNIGSGFLNGAVRVARTWSKDEIRAVLLSLRPDDKVTWTHFVLAVRWGTDPKRLLQMAVDNKWPARSLGWRAQQAQLTQ